MKVDPKSTINKSTQIDELPQKWSFLSTRSTAQHSDSDNRLWRATFFSKFCLLLFTVFLQVP